MTTRRPVKPEAAMRLSAMSRTASARSGGQRTTRCGTASSEAEALGDQGFEFGRRMARDRCGELAADRRRRAPRFGQRAAAVVVERGDERGGVIGEDGGGGELLGGVPPALRSAFGKALGIACGAGVGDERREAALGDERCCAPGGGRDRDRSGIWRVRRTSGDHLLVGLALVDDDLAAGGHVLGDSTMRPWASSTSLRRTGPMASMSSLSSLPERADMLAKKNSLAASLAPLRARASSFLSILAAASGSAARRGGSDPRR